MNAFYSVYGLLLEASFPLPGLPPATASRKADILVRLKSQGASSSSPPPSSLFESPLDSSAAGTRDLGALQFGKLAGGAYYGLFYADGARFAVSRKGSEIWADWPENYTPEDACTYLTGPVLGFALRLLGRVCLHASAIAVDGQAIALLGGPGAGKSTTAAAFALAGFPVLSDDVTVLSQGGTRLLIQPGYPRVNLWPDAVHKLLGVEAALPRITPTWDKQYLPLQQDGLRFADQALPLGAVYFLGGWDALRTSPEIEEIPCGEALVTLAANAYVNYLLDAEMRRRDFDALHQLVSGVPVRKLRCPATGISPAAACEAIAADARCLAPRAEADKTSAGN